MNSMGTNPMRGYVQLDLTPNGEGLARRLKDAFGDAVSIMVGDFPYPYAPAPTDRSTIPDAPVCPMAIEQYREVMFRHGGGPAPAIGTVPGLTLAPVIDEQPTEAGGTFSGHVTFTNNGGEPVTVDDHTLFASVVDAEHRLVRVYTAAQTADGRWSTIVPGASHDVALTGDTGTCVPNTGYTLAPGAYGVIVTPLVTVGRNTQGSPGVAGTIVISPEVTITAR